ncbi:MAG: hypothetical protein IPJ94_29155 [Chloroflexi bacterium]|nr:hypothetical protein [Chloroflexota bacterium]
MVELTQGCHLLNAAGQSAGGYLLLILVITASALPMSLISQTFSNKASYWVVIFISSMTVQLVGEFNGKRPFSNANLIGPH